MPAVLVAVGRWRIPIGGLALVFAIGVGASAVPHESLMFVPIVSVAGLTADFLVRSLGPAVDRPWALSLFAFLVPAILVGLYLATVQATVGLAWPVALWGGSIVLAGAAGVGLALVAQARPAVRQGGG